LNESPVDTVIKIRQDLAEFQRTSNKQEWRETLRKACREALLQAASRPDADPGNDPVTMEYLEERGLLRRPKPPNRRTRRQVNPKAAG